MPIIIWSILLYINILVKVFIIIYNIIMALILASSLSAFGLFIWFKTNFLYEYVKLFKLNKLKLIQEYEAFIKISQLNFSEFLGFKNSFFFKLISCPLCLNFWLNLSLIFFFEFPLYYIGLLYIISITEYMILSIVLFKYENN